MLSGCGLALPGAGAGGGEVWRPKHVHVRYYVEGTAGSAVVVTNTPTGRKTFKVPGPALRSQTDQIGLTYKFKSGHHVYIYVRNLGTHGLVRCYIVINGYQAILQSSADPYGNAKCDAIT